MKTNSTTFKNRLLITFIFFTVFSISVHSQINIALNKPITSNAAFTNLSYSINGNTSDYGYTSAAASTSSPIIITINLGAVYNVISTNINWICGITSYATNYYIQTSTDNSTWKNLGTTITSKTGCGSDAFTGSNSAQYVRIVINSYTISGVPFLMISEIAVYASQTLTSGDATIGGLLTATSISTGNITSTGRLTVSGSATLNGGLNISGNNSLNFNTWSGGFYMSDGTWIRTYNSKNIWTNSGLLGSQGGLTIGYGGATPNLGGAIIAGKVGIGTTAIPTDYTLAVNGGIIAEEVRVTTDVPASDYVFEKSYNLPSIIEVEKYVREHKHLKDMPSADEFKKNGYSVGQMDNLLLKKVEEMMLYIIDLKKENERLAKEIENLKKQ